MLSGVVLERAVRGGCGSIGILLGPEATTGRLSFLWGLVWLVVSVSARSRVQERCVLG
jgi:hypothetical protein